MTDKPVILDASRITTIDERSDVDHHSKITGDMLGEDWGEGFFVEEEPVLVQRDAFTGEITKTTSLSEVPGLDLNPDEDDESKLEVGESRIVPVPLATSDREKLVFILASRLFKWYLSQPPNPLQINPIYDGIPVCVDHTTGCSYECKRPQTKYFGSKGEVFEYLRQIVSSRATIVNKKNNWRGYSPTLTITRRTSGDSSGS